MIVLQELLFPNLEICPSEDMYFRTDAQARHAYVDRQARAVRVPQWCTLDGDTYFNGFSIGKWRKYTALDNLSLQLELSGAFRVQLVHWVRLRDKCRRTVVAEQMCESDGREAFTLAFPDDLPPRGIFGFSLYAVGEGCAFHGGRYLTRADEARLNPVDIAVDICTFRREEYVARNIALLKRDILENPDCELRGHLEVFISDNGRTLDAAALQSGAVHVYPNRNVGGAGGFTRGMIEIIDHPKPFTHALLMDDDVLVSTDALLRTYRLLRLLKPEYAGKTVAGALMRLDKRYMQFECGAVMDGYIPRPRKGNRDMRRVKCLLKNEQEETIHYNGWWYSCIPMAKIDNDNLPLPLFVHRDDIEFGLRTGSDILTLNGICVWHESFDNRYASSMEYYEVRNDLIMTALHKPDLSPVKIAVGLLHRTVGNVVRYRYNNCALLFRGIDDFLAGPDYLMGLDTEALHRDVLAHSDKFVPLEELEKEIPFREKYHRQGLKKKKSLLSTVRIYLLNGLFLPAKGTNVVNIATVWPRNFYRRSAVLNYDELTQKGFITRRSFKRSMAAMATIARKGWRLMRRYRAVGEAYRQAQPIMTSRSFWNEYLGLK